jgi:predicted DNA-binding transcriptional regulator AlpA
MEAQVNSDSPNQFSVCDEDQLLDYAGTAAFLSELCDGKGPSVSTLQSWVSAGSVAIPYLKLGGRFVRFRKSSLRLWIRSRERNLPNGGTQND